MKFSQFLDKKFLEWQMQSGKRRTVAEFAEWLGFPQSTLSTWWSDKYAPRGENVDLLASKLGLEVYDVLGLERPDPDLFYIQQVWSKLPPEARAAIRDDAEKFFAENVWKTKHAQLENAPIDLAVPEPEPAEKDS